MTLSINKEAGKGDRRRATQDDSAYRSNYDLIFGKKVKVETEDTTENISEEKAEDSEKAATIEASQMNTEGKC